MVDRFGETELVRSLPRRQLRNDLLVEISEA